VVPAVEDNALEIPHQVSEATEMLLPVRIMPVRRLSENEGFTARMLANFPTARFRYDGNKSPKMRCGYGCGLKGIGIGKRWDNISTKLRRPGQG
jgi:hypothetical protein